MEFKQFDQLDYKDYLDEPIDLIKSKSNKYILGETNKHNYEKMNAYSNLKLNSSNPELDSRYSWADNFEFKFIIACLRLPNFKFIVLKAK